MPLAEGGFHPPGVVDGFAESASSKAASHLQSARWAAGCPRGPGSLGGAGMRRIPPFVTWVGSAAVVGALGFASFARADDPAPAPVPPPAANPADAPNPPPPPPPEPAHEGVPTPPP